MAKKVVVGMSGGVDSSVAAYLLKEQGYEVIGVTMQIWQDEDPTEVEENGGCCGLSAVDDARRVAEMLDIPYYVMNFKDVFKTCVIDYFVDEYLEARTPNPCIACNRYVKWEALLQKALSLGADYIATGHYARVLQLENGRYSLQLSKTSAKDQTYALYNLTQFQLEHTLMPCGDYTKEEIREIANKMGLLVANKPDSQEICFIPDNDYAGFIEREIKNQDNKEEKRNLPKSGNFVLKDGTILGPHKGIASYTIGQRKGLNLAMGRPVFVTKIDIETGDVTIGEPEDVFTNELYCNKMNFMAMSEPNESDGPIKVLAKIRYSHKGSPCLVTKVGDDEYHCIFEEPVRAVTPGQAVVFYKDDYVLGGGTIIK